MPNWCSNSITISGSTDTIKQLWDDAHVGDDFGLLNAMVPMPKELDGTTKGGAELDQVGRGARVPRAWDGGCVEDQGRELPRVRGRRRQGQRFLCQVVGVSMIEKSFIWVLPSSDGIL